MKEKNIIELGEGNFEQEVLQAKLPVLVDFFATWCGPCKMMAPVLDAFAEEFAGKMKFAKVDVDGCQGLAMQFQITGVPTLIVFKGGQPVDTIVGLMPPASLKARLERFLGRTP
jgi:thioredoxin 1